VNEHKVRWPPPLGVGLSEQVALPLHPVGRWIDVLPHLDRSPQVGILVQRPPIYRDVGNAASIDVQAPTAVAKDVLSYRPFEGLTEKVGEQGRDPWQQNEQGVPQLEPDPSSLDGVLGLSDDDKVSAWNGHILRLDCPTPLGEGRVLLLGTGQHPVGHPAVADVALRLGPQLDEVVELSEVEVDVPAHPEG
jgi:hypothetical protein